MQTDAAVQERYSAAAKEREAALCCPIADYDPRLLQAIPEEVLERDYGCGDPSRFVQPGDTVVDLGSGGGKICFIASQIVGAEGRVIGVDRNADMLDLARRSAPRVAEQVGYGNVAFRVGRIQDLALDLERLEAWLAEHPVRSREDLFAMEAEAARLRREETLIPDASVDVVLSNCVLNLVAEDERRQLFAELYRVVKDGGQVAISDIVSDEDVPERLRHDGELWSGCISGAFREDRFLQAFADVGFHGVQLVKRDPQPWQTVDGIEFRAVTVLAYKGKEGPCREGQHAILYPGPWSEVHDDDGHVYRRGERSAVCSKTYRLLSQQPYLDQVIPLPPYREIPDTEQGDFPCDRAFTRHPRETKNGEFPDGYAAGDGCCSGGGCC